MKKLALSFIVAFIYNTAIAGLLTAVGRMSGHDDNWFWCNFVFSQCIGFSITLSSAVILTQMKSGRLRWVAHAVSLPLSIVFGVSVGFKLTGMGEWSHASLWPSMFVGLFFGIIAMITFILFERIELLNQRAREREIQVIEQTINQEKRALEAQLKMLQAQIEPHFLFNTLANVSSLIDVDATLAKKLLERLNDWLRVALVRTRSEHTTLGDELDMLENYLEILKVRFGARLHWECDIADDARQSRFPPMLLQPLVENAVRHGIEPKVGGGKILLHAHVDAGVLHISVSDSGSGFSAVGQPQGAGLANIRLRLAALFGQSGSLILRNRTEGGAIALLQLPSGEPVGATAT